MGLRETCQASIPTSEYAITSIVDYIMMTIAAICLVMTLYGIYQYVLVYRRSASDNPALNTPKYLYISGLIFLITSSFTLFNALVYDILYLICPALDDYEVVLYHTAYFAQIYSLWIVLFLRIYFVFTNSALRLSKCVIKACIAAFICVVVTIIPLYMIFELEADSFITLPYITLSTIFCTLLLGTFMYKLFEMLMKFGVDTFLLNTMTKHTLLSVISISWTLLVVLLLTILAIRHHGDYSTHSVMEELILEVFILLDVVSNFICVLLTYSFFDKQYQRLCGGLHERFYKYLSGKVIVAIEHLNSIKGAETTKTSDIKSLDSPKTDAISLSDAIARISNSRSNSNSQIQSKVLVLSRDGQYSVPIPKVVLTETIQKPTLICCHSVPLALSSN